MLALGSDHGGYNLKEAIKKYLDEKGIEYQDFGTYSTDSIDYAPIACLLYTSLSISNEGVITVDKEETKRRREKIARMQNKLFR